MPVATHEEAVEYGESITHGTRMPVIDPNGRIAGWYELSGAAITGDGATGEGATAVGPAIEAGDEAIAARYRLVESRLKATAGRPYWRPSSGSPLPLVNACLNMTATVLLLLGLIAIKGDRRERHELMMKLAFIVSAAFLASYLYYHGVVQRKYGPTPFNGTGGARVAYLSLLASHVLLAIINLPMVLRTFWLAHKERWDAHKRLARLTFPIWLYVSVTGVVVYVVLYHLNPVP